MLRNSVKQECPTRQSNQRAMSGCPTTMSGKKCDKYCLFLLQQTCQHLGSWASSCFLICQRVRLSCGGFLNKIFREKMNPLCSVYECFCALSSFLEWVARIPVSLWGSGGEAVFAKSSICDRSRRQRFATVGNHVHEGHKASFCVNEIGA